TSEEAAGVAIHRSLLPDTGWVFQTTVALGTETWTDEDVSDDTAYYYILWSYDAEFVPIDSSSVESGLVALTAKNPTSGFGTRVFFEDFPTDADEGSDFWTTYTEMDHYPGGEAPWPDTSANGRYSGDYVSASGG